MMTRATFASPFSGALVAGSMFHSLDLGGFFPLPFGKALICSEVRLAHYYARRHLLVALIIVIREIV